MPRPPHPIGVLPRALSPRRETTRPADTRSGEGLRHSYAPCRLSPAGGSVARELAIRDAVRARGFRTEPRHLVVLVVGEVALEPEPAGRVLLVALPRQDVGGHPVEEPAVMADDYG